MCSEERFIKKIGANRIFSVELKSDDFENRKLALFIAILKLFEEKNTRTPHVPRIRKIRADDKILKYHLKFVMIGFFGRVLDYNNMSFLTQKAMEIGYGSLLQKNGFKEVEPGVYDLRDWDEIRNWAKELARKAQD